MTDDNLSERLAELARDARSRTDVADAADDIVVAASELFARCAGAGVTLVHGRRSVETAAATNRMAREGDRLQYDLGEGPCLDAAWREEQVYSSDLARDERWPIWGPRVADELGVASMLCTRLFTNDEQLGALNLYGEKPDAFDDEDREVARLLAAHAAVAVASAREIQTLRVAVDRRTTIGKALGVIMARYDLDDDRAMAVLRRLSSHQNRKLYDVALEVVDELRVPAEEG